MVAPKKKIRTLEKGLLKTLLDPPDSEARRRYVKKWLYGELKPAHQHKTIREKLKETLRKWP